MTTNRAVAFLLALALVAAVVAMAAAKPAPAPALKPYGLVLLRTGARPPIPDSVAQAMQAGHLANIRSMFVGGALVAAGPFGDDSPLRGIFLFDADSLDELPRLLAPDPILRAGRLVPTVLRWQAPVGFGEAYRARGVVDPGGRDTMVTFTMVLLHRGPKWTANVTKGLPALLERQRAELDRQRASGKLVVAGPIEGLGELRGVYLYDADTTATRALVAKDPAVKAGRLVPEIHPWWVAKGVVPGH